MSAAGKLLFNNGTNGIDLPETKKQIEKIKKRI